MTAEKDSARGALEGLLEWIPSGTTETQMDDVIWPDVLADEIRRRLAALGEGAAWRTDPLPEGKPGEVIEVEGYRWRYLTRVEPTAPLPCVGPWEDTPLPSGYEGARIEVHELPESDGPKYKYAWAETGAGWLWEEEGNRGSWGVGDDAEMFNDWRWLTRRAGD